MFEIPLLARRLEGVTRWAIAEPDTRGLPVGYFGASTGAAAALRAAAAARDVVQAVVSRGGRPDLAADRLPYVTAATLLLVGGRDPEVLELNRRAAAMLRCPHRLVVIEAAGHLFSEPGTLSGWRAWPPNGSGTICPAPSHGPRRPGVEVMSATFALPLGEREALAALRREAHPLTGDHRDYDALLELIGDARFVLLGEASHGTHEFYRERARITRRLIEEKGFTARGGRGRLARRLPRQPLRARRARRRRRRGGAARLPALPDLDVAQRRRARLRRLAACPQRRTVERSARRSASTASISTASTPRSRR